MCREPGPYKGPHDLRGRGGGEFETESRYAVGNGPHAAAIADFDGDGLQDVAVVNAYSWDVSVLLGSDDGALGADCRNGAAGSRGARGRGRCGAGVNRGWPGRGGTPFPEPRWARTP